MRISKKNSRYKTYQEYLKVFFPTTINERYMLDSNIQSSESLNVFKNKVLKFI